MLDDARSAGIAWLSLDLAHQVNIELGSLLAFADGANDCAEVNRSLRIDCRRSGALRVEAFVVAVLEACADSAVAADGAVVVGWGNIQRLGNVRKDTVDVCLGLRQHESPPIRSVSTKPPRLLF